MGKTPSKNIQPQEPHNGRRTKSIPQISYKEIEFGSNIGFGCAGVVQKGRWAGRQVAIKSIYPGVDKDFKNEVQALSCLRHPAMVDLVAICLENDHLCILTEYLPLGSLHDYIHSKESKNVVQEVLRNWPLLFRFATDISACMCYVHQQGYLHRDLKPSNILLVSFSPQAEVTAKLCDFGTGRPKSRMMTSVVGTVPYMAPEMFESTSYTAAIDVYSFGVLLWEILTRTEPYKDWFIYEISAAVRAGERLSVPSHSPPPVSNLIQNCWKQNPKDRPSFTYIHSELKLIGNNLMRASSTNLKMLKSYDSNSNSRESVSETSCPSQVITSPLFPSTIDYSSSSVTSEDSISHTEERASFNTSDIPIRKRTPPLVEETIPTHEETDDKYDESDDEDLHKKDGPEDLSLSYLRTKLPNKSSLVGLLSPRHIPQTKQEKEVNSSSKEKLCKLKKMAENSPSKWTDSYLKPENSMERERRYSESEASTMQKKNKHSDKSKSKKKSKVIGKEILSDGEALPSKKRDKRKPSQPVTLTLTSDLQKAMLTSKTKQSSYPDMPSPHNTEARKEGLFSTLSSLEHKTFKVSFQSKKSSKHSDSKQSKRNEVETSPSTMRSRNRPASPVGRSRAASVVTPRSKPKLISTPPSTPRIIPTPSEPTIAPLIITPRKPPDTFELPESPTSDKPLTPTLTVTPLKPESEIVIPPLSLISDSKLHRNTSMTFAHNEIQVNQLVLDEKPLQVGLCGKWFHALWKYASVRVFVSHIDFKTELLSEFRQEVARLQILCNHPFIASIYGACTVDNQQICLVSQYCRFTIHDIFVSRLHPLPRWHTMIAVARAVAAGIQHLHKYNVCYVEFTSKSILLDPANWEPMLTDIMEMSYYVPTKRSTSEQEALYHFLWMAPECFDNRKRCLGTDSFTFGILLWQMMNLQEPFPDKHPLEVVDAVTNSGLRLSLRFSCKEEIEDWNHSCDSLLELMRHCWMEEPDARADFNLIYSTLDSYHRELTSKI